MEHEVKITNWVDKGTLRPMTSFVSSTLSVSIASDIKEDFNTFAGIDEFDTTTIISLMSIEGEDVSIESATTVIKNNLIEALKAQSADFANFIASNITIESIRK